MQAKDKNKEIFHDLLNSLTVIAGNLNIALKDENSDKMLKHIRKAELANRKAIEICKIHLNDTTAERVDIKSFYQQSLPVFRELYPKINISFESQLAQMVEVDSIYLYRVTENVIKNSIEADASKLSILLDKDKISFHDNGSGITKDCVEKIAEKGSSKKYGNGIGLSSVSDFCQKHNFQLVVGNNSKNDIFDRGFHVIIKF